MTVAFDPSDEAIFDGTEPVLIKASPDEQGVLVAGALRRQVTEREAAASDGRYQVHDTVWHLPASGLTAAPGVGSVVVDAAGDRYTVLEVARTSLGSRYRVRARNLVLAGKLDRLVSVEIARWEKSRDGAPQASWALHRQGVAARVQPAGAPREEQNGQVRPLDRYSIYIAEQLPLDRDLRIRAGDEVYRVVDRHQAQRIEGLLTLEAVREVSHA